MDHNLLRQYLATVYDLPTASGPLRVSLDGDIVQDPAALLSELEAYFAAGVRPPSSPSQR